MMQANHFHRAAALLLGALLPLMAAGCGGRGEPDAAASSAPPPAETPAPALTEAPAPAVTEAPADTQGAGETAAPTDADRALFDQLVQANSFPEILKRHSSKQVEVTYYDGNDEEIHRFTHYVDADQFAEETSAGTGHIVMDTLYLWSLTNENGPFLMEVFLDREEAYQELLAGRQEDSSLSIESVEALTEVTELNGCWYMTTEVTDADWVRARIASDGASSGFEPVYTYADGMSISYTYTFDKETQDLLEIWTYLREADGTQHSYDLDRTTYDLDYDVAESAFAPYFEATEFCTFHLVFAPGTPEESSMSYMIPKERVYWALEYQGEEYLGDVYTDPECTQVYVGGERPDEITLYVPARSN